MTFPRVMAFAREAGGASALEPVLQALGRERLLLLAKDHAVDVFKRFNFVPKPLPNFSPEILAQACRSMPDFEQPDVVLTSAASLPQLDMTEKLMWRWALERGIPSVAVLDQWQNYAARFSGPLENERLAYLPDRVAVMDDLAKKAMIAEGVPADRLVVTGQPAFDRLAQAREAFSEIDRVAIRRRWGVAPDARVICFVAEALGQDFGVTLGYTEQTVLRFFADVCQSVRREIGQPLWLVVKQHPQNDPAEFEWLKSFPWEPGLQVSMIGKEEAPLRAVLASDVVVGMTSILLMESILLGRPTVSVQPGARRTDGLAAVERGAIPLVRAASEARRIMSGLLTDASFREAYLTSQRQIRSDGKAAGRVATLVHQAAQRRVPV